MFQNFIKKLIVILTLFLGLFSMPASYAAVPIDPNLFPEGAATISGQKPTGQSQIGAPYLQAARVALIQRIVTAILGIAGVVAIFFILNNSFWLIASGGAEEKITQHKKGLMWAVIGLILIILSYSIIRFIISIPFQADQRTAQQEVQPK